jgi:hypothetical protein
MQVMDLADSAKVLRPLVPILRGSASDDIALKELKGALVLIWLAADRDDDVPFGVRQLSRLARSPFRRSTATDLVERLIGAAERC